jgi:hypothetical protein
MRGRATTGHDDRDRSPAVLLIDDRSALDPSAGLHSCSTGERADRMPARALFATADRVRSGRGRARIHTEARVGAAISRRVGARRANYSSDRRGQSAARSSPNERGGRTRQPSRREASSPIVGVPNANVSPVRVSRASNRRACAAARAGAGRGEGGRGPPTEARKPSGSGVVMLASWKVRSAWRAAGRTRTAMPTRRSDVRTSDPRVWHAGRPRQPASTSVTVRFPTRARARVRSGCGMAAATDPATPGGSRWAVGVSAKGAASELRSSERHGAAQAGVGERAGVGAQSQQVCG